MTELFIGPSGAYTLASGTLKWYDVPNSDSVIHYLLIRFEIFMVGSYSFHKCPITSVPLVRGGAMRTKHWRLHRTKYILGLLFVICSLCAFFVGKGTSRSIAKSLSTPKVKHQEKRVITASMAQNCAVMEKKAKPKGKTVAIKHSKKKEMRKTRSLKKSKPKKREHSEASIVASTPQLVSE